MLKRRFDYYLTSIKQKPATNLRIRGCIFQRAIADIYQTQPWTRHPIFHLLKTSNLLLVHLSQCLPVEI